MMSVNGDVHTIILRSSTTNTTKDLYYDGNMMPLAGVKAILDTSTGGLYKSFCLQKSTKTSRVGPKVWTEGIRTN